MIKNKNIFKMNNFDILFEKMINDSNKTVNSIINDINIENDMNTEIKDIGFISKLLKFFKKYL